MPTGLMIVLQYSLCTVMKAAYLALPLFFAASAFGQTTRFVSTSGADVGDCSVSPCATIQYAINQAVSGDHVLVQEGVFLEANVVIDKNLIISGAGRSVTEVHATTVEECHESVPGLPLRVFAIPEGVSVTIQDLRMSNGCVTDFGGGIVNEGTLLIQRSIISGNRVSVAGADALAKGGGIYNTGNLITKNTRITGNSVLWMDNRSNNGGGIFNSGTATLENTVVDDNVAGSYCNGCGDGGGIANEGTMTLKRVAVVDNSALGVGGIVNDGVLHLVNTTVSGHDARAEGFCTAGGIASEGVLTIESSTITRNSCDGGPGGVSADLVYMKNSIFAGNEGPGPSPDFLGPTDLECGEARSFGFNLVQHFGFNPRPTCTLVEVENGSTDKWGLDAVLEPLFDNGGTTFTHALSRNSPAIDAGSCELISGSLIEYDQRGLRRRDERCDMGAFEYGAEPIGGSLSANGSFVSPAGACRTLCDNIEVSASFRTGAKFHPSGATGKTTLSLGGGNFEFRSEAYDWLLVVEAKALLKGRGTINKQGNYGFQLTAVDPDFTASSDVGLIRIRIWDNNAGGALVYDNQPGAIEDADPTTVITDGSIRIRGGNQLSRQKFAESSPEVAGHASPSLAQNYPNPFNPSTAISYDLPQAADVTLAVYDVLGRQVRELASGTKPPGTNEVTFHASGLPSGVYFYRLQAGDYVETKRMVVVK